MAVAFRGDYEDLDRKYEGQTYKMAGNTLLTWPSDIDSSRLCMNTGETKQSLTLLNPDVPRLSTGWENVLGKRNKNRSFIQLDGTWEVMDIIPKFTSKNNQIYTIVVYNEETDTYDMLEKQVTENLPEKFGFVYNNDRMDQLKVGDVITDEIISKSTAYDDNMNYRYGKNAKVYYSTSTHTIEDAVYIRQGWADGVKSCEVDTVGPFGLNINHVPLNLYGDESEYKVCPDFGEPIRDSLVFAYRPVNKNHILQDFKNSELKKVRPATDTDFYVSDADASYIYDINIYYNSSDPFPDNTFFRQLKGYYDDICVYADRMASWAKKIKKSGSKYTGNISYFKSKYQHYNDPEYLFCGKEKNHPFGNIVIEFKTVSIIGIVPGSKMAGRYGDKGVISTVASDPGVQNLVTNTMDSILDMLGREINDEERAKLAEEIHIVPDDQMPYTDRFPVDIILNASGAIRRLNPGQLVEVDLNFQGEEVRNKVTTLSTREEKIDLIFDFLNMVSSDECRFFYEMYHGFETEYTVDGKHVVLSDDRAKDAFIRDIEENGFYLRKEHDSAIRYETIREIYKHFDFIKPLPLYIDAFGTTRRRIIKDGIVGDKYMMILKHNNNKNFSARSTFRVNRANLPVKDTTKRDNRSQYSRSPVRIGEAYNMMMAISGALLAEYNIFMRSSTLGKKSLRQILETSGNPLEIKRLKLKDNYINTNADIFNAKFKGIGARLKFVRDGEEEPDMLEDVATPLVIGKYVIYDTPLKRQMYNHLFAIFTNKMEEITVMEQYPGHKADLVWDEIFKLPEVQEYQIPEETQEMIRIASKNEGIDVRSILLQESEEETGESTDDDSEDSGIE